MATSDTHESGTREDPWVLKTPPGTSEYTINLMVLFNDPDLYGLRLALNGKKAKGSIEIEYYSNEDLDRILEILGLTEQP